MKKKILSEDDFEKDINTSVTTVGIKKYDGDTIAPVDLDGNQLQPSDGVLINPDKINNIGQKEDALARTGVTREKYLRVIAAALEAKRWVDEPDEQGNIRRVLKDDAVRQQWGAEQAAKLYGDMIERKEIEHDVGDKTIEKFKGYTVAQMKAEMQAILNGQPVSRLPAIEINGAGRNE